MSKIIIPPYLKPGDTIGIVCPAGFMAEEKAATCIKTLQEWGFQVKTGKTLGGNSQTYFSGTDEERLNDLQSMMDDPNVRAILCGRGGYGTGRIIENIRFKKFRKKPKWIIGYSDITILHTHIYSNYGIATLHSPMAGAFNDEGFKNPYVTSLRNAITGKPARYVADIHPFNSPGRAKGQLVGGNLALLAHSMGTSSEPPTRNRILFIEDVGEYSYNIDRMMYQLKRNGKLDDLAGLIIGKFTDMKDTERPFGKSVEDIIHDLVSEYNYPICYGFPVSHGDENYALKIGVDYKLIVAEGQVLLTEESKPK